MTLRYFLLHAEKNFLTFFLKSFRLSNIYLYLCTEIVKFVTKLPIFMKNIGIRSQKSHGRRRTDLCPGLPEDALEW